MHKRNKQQKPIGAAPLDTDQPKPGMTPQAIWETMNHPEFDAEQLPELWQQAMEPDDTSVEQDNAWHAGAEAMYRRCETYGTYILE